MHAMFSWFGPEAMPAMLSISRTYENTADYKIQTHSERLLENWPGRPPFSTEGETFTPPLGGRVTHPSLQRPEVRMAPSHRYCRLGVLAEWRGKVLATEAA